MRQAPVGEVHSFIKKWKASLLEIDFSVKKEEQPEVTERIFEELCLQPGVAVYPIGTTYMLVGDQILKEKK